ncbi:MAG TPA: 4Fe-4S dicluster domain-containing protein [Candidatus Kapabacteria bacterium]|mgnify:CR=1 FL=1|nr:4Fe-4S dicluster domain-containing protein [Candidatus Kapabacteria bacterium]HPO62980.1 4Fe-4S dicluster domain-containing protein [Candidatus Kapabacteria bacterium]
MDRRYFLKTILAATSIGFASCRRQGSKIAPAVYPDDLNLPGEAIDFASCFVWKNASYGMLVRTREGKPYKIDGNPLHPVNSGSSSAQMQAALFDLWNPKRFFKPTISGIPADLQTASKYYEMLLNKAISENKKIYFILEENCSPTLFKLSTELNSVNPNIKFINFDFFNSNNKIKVNKEFLNIENELVPDFSNLNLIISFADDFLGNSPYSLYFSKEFFKNETELFTFESTLSQTGICSNKRICTNFNDYEEILKYIFTQLAKKVKLNEAEQSHLNNLINQLTPNNYQVIDRYKIELDLLINKILINFGKTVFLAGNSISYNSHLLCFLINYLISAYKENSIYSLERSIPNYWNNAKLSQEFFDDAKKGSIGLVILANSNIYSKLNNELKGVFNQIPKEKRVAISLYQNETTKQCSIVFPSNHLLESWGDGLSFEGTIAIQQRIVEKLNETSTQFEDLLLNTAKIIALEKYSNYESYYDYLKENWLALSNNTNTEEIISNGFFKIESNIEIKSNENLNFIITNAISKFNAEEQNSVRSKNEITFFAIPSPSVYDGSFSENTFLKELKDPITGLSYSNALVMNQQTALRYDLSDNAIAEISNATAKVELPVLIIKSVANNFVYSHLGNESLIPFFKLNPEKDSYCLFSNVKLRKVKEAWQETTRIAFTSEHQKLFLTENKPAKQHIFSKNIEYKLHHWGMVIDLSKCNGCGACVIACQMENNVPCVGEKDVENGRLMNWLNIKRFESENKQSNVFLPMLCQHCEQAPCEKVCPVSAVTHSPEGINETTYNRCVGSRYCIANCPYKIRKFNFSDYHKNENLTYKNIYNPEVTLRMRGIVEKCSFCVQRINAARYEAKDKGSNEIKDGEVKTACEQACPNAAIIFGNLLNENSKIRKILDSKYTIRLLEEFNTLPSVFYLPKKV